jgi:hypothetical protein
MAVAAAAYEEETVMGWVDARRQFLAAIVTAGEEDPDAGNPFGPDPARAASVGVPDDGYYRGQVPVSEAFHPADTTHSAFPVPPTTAGGRRA